MHNSRVETEPPSVLRRVSRVLCPPWWTRETDKKDTFAVSTVGLGCRRPARSPLSLTRRTGEPLAGGWGRGAVCGHPRGPPGAFCTIMSPRPRAAHTPPCRVLTPRLPHRGCPDAAWHLIPSLCSPITLT